MIKTDFTCDIDTIEARKDVKKTVLLSSSEFSRQITVPALISLDDAAMPIKQEQFTSVNLPVAVLLEGKFESAFKNRMVQQLFNDTTLKPIEEGMPSKMMVVADADIIRNDIRPTPQGILISPLGYDRYTSQTFGNKEFIVNAIQYITGQQGLIDLRSRTITLRLLNKVQTNNNRTFWILINTLIPPFLVIIAGIIYSFARRKRYTAESDLKEE